MITYSVLGKNWKCRKCQNGYCRFGQVLGRDRVFQVTTEFLLLCRDNGFLCRDKGSLCRDKGSLCRNKGSLCRDMVLRLQVVSWSQHSFSMSRQCFTSLS